VKCTQRTNEGHISNVVDYLTSLDIVEAKINPVTGGGFLIKVLLKDGTAREFDHNGNIYLIEKNGFTGQMPYAGDGWLILHDKDLIRVFYNKDVQKDINIINASTVYIKAQNSAD